MCKKANITIHKQMKNKKWKMINSSYKKRINEIKAISLIKLYLGKKKKVLNSIFIFLEIYS